jgi:hypothetical protein
MPVAIIAGLVERILGVKRFWELIVLKVGVTYYTDLTYCHR